MSVSKQMEEFYDRYPYPNTRNQKLYVENDNVYCVSMTSPILQEQKTILIVGCGTQEGIVTSNTNPLSKIYATDLSSSQIAIAKSIQRKYGNKNLIHFRMDITKKHLDKLVDYVSASGVLHHIENVDDAIKNIKMSMKQDAIFSGMVYHTNERPLIIKNLNKEFLGKEVKDIINIISLTDWYQYHDKSENEVADTWLNPYFKEYSPQELYDLLSTHFKYIKVFIRKNYKANLIFFASDTPISKRLETEYYHLNDQLVECLLNE